MGAWEAVCRGSSFTEMSAVQVNCCKCLCNCLVSWQTGGVGHKPRMHAAVQVSRHGHLSAFAIATCPFK